MFLIHLKGNHNNSPTVSKAQNQQTNPESKHLFPSITVI